MLESRRRLFSFAGSGIVLLLLGSRKAAAQLPANADHQSVKQRDDDAVPHKLPTKAILEANEKDIKKNVEKLFQLASELKDQVNKTDSAKVLSLSLVKKAEEIEKLARQIKDRARG